MSDNTKIEKKYSDKKLKIVNEIRNALDNKQVMFFFDYNTKSYNQKIMTKKCHESNILIKKYPNKLVAIASGHNINLKEQTACLIGNSLNDILNLLTQVVTLKDVVCRLLLDKYEFIDDIKYLKLLIGKTVDNIRASIISNNETEQVQLINMLINR